MEISKIIIWVALILFPNPLLSSTIAPSSTQVNTLKSDNIKDFVWDDNGKAFVAYGEKYLWVWHIETNKLQRQAHNSQIVSKIFMTEKHYWLIGNSIIQRISKENLDTRYFDFSRFGPILGSSVEKGTISIVTENKIIHINSRNLRLKVQKKITTKNRSIFLLNSIWEFQNKLEIIEEDKKKKVLHCPNSAIEPKQYNTSILFICDSKIYRFSEIGNLLQVIPVRNKSKIYSWFITNEIHGYHFENKLLEIYRPDKVESKKVFLSNLFETFTIRGESIIGLSQGVPTVELF